MRHRCRRRLRILLAFGAGNRCEVARLLLLIEAFDVQCRALRLSGGMVTLYYR